MKKELLTLLLIGLGFVSQAQRTDTTILMALPADQPTVARLKVKLVELALNNPDMRVHDLKKLAAKYEANRAKAEWLNHFVASGNLNEFTIKNGNNNTFFPRYNFGVSVPLGNFIGIPNAVKMAKTNGKIAEEQKKSDALELKAMVLEAYEEYAANKQLLELQLPLLEDALNTFRQTEEQFSNGAAGVTVENYNATYRQYNTEMVRKVELERNLRKSKITLEGMIGMTLEEVLLQL